MSIDRLHPSLVHNIANTLLWPGLRPLQAEAVEPILDGEDAILLAPTAGGKTEAAAFPLLTAMAEQRWSGLSVLYLCPIKALLNNLLPRLETYAGWVGRTAGMWHGDVTAGRKARIRNEPPDMLLTTPESLEGLLISTKTDHGALFANLRAVVVDEVHAFASDDRGWHLRAVLERLANLADRPLQRIGASATVGNPAELLTWLQGSQAGRRPGRVIAPEVEPPDAEAAGAPPPGEVELDFVGSIHNAAKVIASLHQGEKRLVFCDSRRLVEQLASELRELGTTTFLSHASLSVDERRQAETAFAEGRDCVIVATSTLELGIDVGDLDRVIQINAPRTVASFLQRIGRTGRREGTARNCLFLALDEAGLLDAAGLLRLWGDHWVEPVTAPPEPAHIVAQQVLALCLQGRVGDRLWPKAWNGLAPFDAGAKPIVDHLASEGFLDNDGGMLFIGPNAERRFGTKHFAELTAVFCSPPEFTVMHGRDEIGKIDPAVLETEPDGAPGILLLAGRSWTPVHIDWRRQRCHIEPSGEQGSVRWNPTGVPSGRAFHLVRGIRRVLLGEDPPVSLTRRAAGALAEARERGADRLGADRTLIRRDGSEVRWWTWAGFRVNLTLQSSLRRFAAPNGVTDFYVRLRSEYQVSELSRAISEIEIVPPRPDPRAVNGLKFSAALPSDLATATLAARLADREGAQTVLDVPRMFVL